MLEQNLPEEFKFLLERKEQLKCELRQIEALEAYLVETCSLRKHGGNYVEYLRSLPKAARLDVLDALIADSHHEIHDTDEFNMAASETNATGFVFDEYEINALSVFFKGKKCSVELTFGATGDQDEDKLFCGTRVVGDCKAVITPDGRVSYRNVRAEVEWEDADAEAEAKHEEMLGDGGASWHAVKTYNRLMETEALTKDRYAY